MVSKTFRRILPMAYALCLVAACAAAAQAQVTTGNVRGVVTDPQGAVVPGAKVTITKKSSNESRAAQTSGEGEFQFNNLPVGDDYTVTVEAANFKTLTLSGVRVQLNQVTDLPAQLTVGGVGETVEITAGGAELVNTTTPDLSKSFGTRQVVELAMTTASGAGVSGAGAGVNNLALFSPNVTSSGGVGVGVGGSVGGQRPRNNNFMVDGIDNNDKVNTGPQSYISPEEVAEFTLLQNQFSAEFGRSNGGQFLTVTKSGTNDLHGTFYGFFRNRYLNALDNLQKQAGVTRNRSDGDLFMPRSDYFRGGYNFGGPVVLPTFGMGDRWFKVFRDKLFFFTSYERLQRGSAASAGSLVAPTTAGFAALGAIPGVSATNLGVLRQYLPAAPAGDAGTLTVGGRAIPLGSVTFPAPNFNNQNHAVINFDYDQSTATQHRFRFTFTNRGGLDTFASLPVFYAPLPVEQRLFSYTVLHNFSSKLINETRLAFRRSVNLNPVPDFAYPGLDVFPNITLDELGVDIGPDLNAPSTTIENNYQVVNNVTYLAGNHTLKFGGDFRNVISPQRFVQRERGQYEYLTLERFLFDLMPDGIGERNVGGNTYYGNQKMLYAFAQDDWRFRPNLTLNLGLGYSYQGMPLGAKFQEANAISSVPGLIEFRAPKAQKKNFAPKVGFAYSPDYKSGLLGSLLGSGGRSSIRAGFSMAYDFVFDNIYILSSPPQAQQTIDCPDACPNATNFLARGAIPPTVTGGLTDAATARSVTGTFIPDQQVPYSLTWTGSFQRQLGKDWSFEARYLGTRGIHLLTQNRINRQAKVAPEDGRPGLPTFLTAPTQAQIDALTLTLDDINARSSFVPRYAAAGFNGSNIVAFLSDGNSTYHGASAQVQKRFSKGFQTTFAYTWSHLIDDTTAEVFSTVLSPRRVEDFQNLRRERADSALDHRHRFVAAWIYELPFFLKSSNGFLKATLGGFQIAGTYTIESGEKVTVRSGNDANLNGDSAGDRAILNPAGQEGVGSLVDPLVRTDGQVVGYVARNPNARYIQTGNGAQSNIGRNTFALPPINNFDISLFKNIHVGESKYFQLRADFFNAFNHPQYVPGSVNTVDWVDTTGLTTLNQVAPLTPDFLRPDRVLSSHSRVIQLAARFNF
jgi:hypothetical protein